MIISYCLLIKKTFAKMKNKNLFNKKTFRDHSKQNVYQEIVKF